MAGQAAVYRRSIGRWRNHGPELGPLLGVLVADAYAMTPSSASEGAQTSDQATTPSA